MAVRVRNDGPVPSPLLILLPWIGPPTSLSWVSSPSSNSPKEPGPALHNLPGAQTHPVTQKWRGGQREVREEGGGSGGKALPPKNHPFLSGLGSLARVLDSRRLKFRLFNFPLELGAIPLPQRSLCVCMGGESNIWDLYRV